MGIEQKQQRSQSWQSCDATIKDLVDEITNTIVSELGDNVLGIYLHGSLAMGSYYYPKSDIDLIVVVTDQLPVNTRRSVSKAIAKLSAQRPTVGDIELSIITSEIARTIPNPPPFEVHCSSDWYDKIIHDQVDYTVNRTDIDLLAHLMYVTKRGIVLYGKPIDEVFGEVRWSDFMDAVIDDFDWILEDKHILETPFYAVLNICRVLQLKSEDDHIPRSKDEGGEWALQHLPKIYHVLIKKALSVYRSGDEVTEATRRIGGVTWDESELLAFRDYAKKRKSD